MRWMTLADVEWLLALARRFDALVWITYDRLGMTQPLLMPFPWRRLD